MTSNHSASSTTGEPARAGLDVSVVIPALNEEASIPGAIGEALQAIREARVKGEVLVVDNGSEDRTAQVAADAGARVVPEPARGYGRAYLAGIAAARGRVVFMGDADSTYDFGELSNFLARVGDGADVVMGSRLRGTIMPGAMAGHRRFGNVVLTGMLNILFRSGVSDAHCGLRMATRDALDRMGLESPGMEFASEMVIKAKRARLRIDEIPITYRARHDHNPSKLRAIPDGLRHVRYMLSQAPLALFWGTAAVLAAVGLELILDSGPVGQSAVAGTVLMALAGIVAPAGYWLRMHPSSGERTRLLPAWVGSRTAMAGLALVGLGAMAGGGVLLGNASNLRLNWSGERVALIVLAAGIAVLGSTMWAAWIRRRTLARSPARSPS
jgi:hypothetical protein